MWGGGGGSPWAAGMLCCSAPFFTAEGPCCPWPRCCCAAQLDCDRDGLISVRELKDALEECNIRCDPEGRAAGAWEVGEAGEAPT